MDWIDMAENLDRWMAFVNTVKKLLVAYMQGHSLLAEELLASQKDSAASLS
jgi:hypothetical protein